MKPRQEIIQKHQAFWNRDTVEVPLVGIFLGGWTFFKDNRGGDNIWQKDTLSPDQLDPERFVPDYLKLFEAEVGLGDDLIRAAQPFASVPWMEAMMGCPIRCAKPNVWADPMAESLAELPRIEFDPDNPWVRKYVDFLKVFDKHFAGQHPAAASILRGPGDLLSAAIGDSKAVYAYIDQPEQTTEVLKQLANLFMAFIKHQWIYTSKCDNGYILAQNEIWAPGPTLRIQEDASALLSPEIYQQYLLPRDREISGLTKHNVMHLHTTSLHLLKYILELETLTAIQISKDDGYGHVRNLVPALESVQQAGKRLILRGRFELDELEMIQTELSPVGLCVHTVVDTQAEGLEHLGLLKQNAWSLERSK